MENNLLLGLNRAIDLVSLHQDSLYLAWHEAFLFTDVNDKPKCFLDNAKYLYDKYVPLKTIKIQNTKPSWFNHEM